MEDTLRVCTPSKEIWRKNSLNPCFNGRYSQSVTEFKDWLAANVLILVLMEDTLRDPFKQVNTDKTSNSLNPCFNGRYSQRSTGRLNPCFNGRYSQRLAANPAATNKES